MSAPSTVLRLLRIVADDGSHGFEHRAQPGEWAVPGICAFAAEDPARLPPARAAALRQGFLGLESGGWSREVETAELDARTFDGLTLRLAAWLRESVGAPDLDAALALAREELDYARQLATDAPPGARLCVTRTLDDGEIRENYRLTGTTAQPGIGTLAELIERVRGGG